MHHDLNTAKSYFDSALILKTSLIACGPIDEVFSVDNLTRAFGETGALFDEAFKLSQKKAVGVL